MDNLSNAVTGIIPIQPIRMSNEDYNKFRVEHYNKSKGNLTGYDCPKCLNRGYFLRIDEEGYEKFRECECWQIRQSYKNIENSGLAELVATKTFDSFKTETEWQLRMKGLALKFLDANNEWLTISGISGCGKTHLCTAVCTELMKKGRVVKYMLWGDINQKLDSNKFNEQNYNDFMMQLRTVDILYIDDFLKTGIKGNTYVEPPAAEVKNAYSVINARYLANKKTIISTELFADELCKIDTAVGGRIKQMSKNYMIQIKREDDRNYRLKG